MALRGVRIRVQLWGRCVRAGWHRCASSFSRALQTFEGTFLLVVLTAVVLRHRAQLQLEHHDNDDDTKTKYGIMRSGGADLEVQSFLRSF